MLLVVAGIGLLRRAWRRGWGPVLLAWVPVIAGLAWLTLREGAWGLSVGAIAAMLVAAGVLGHAAWSSKPKRTPERAEREPTVALRPEGWRGLARRIAIFLLAVPVSGATAVLLALALQATMRASGVAEANGIALSLLILPIAWATIATLVMLEERLAAMLRLIAIVAAVGGGVFWSVA